MISDRIMLSKFRNKKCCGWNTLCKRGMNIYNDIIDWLGGLPYEVTSTK